VTRVKKLALAALVALTLALGVSAPTMAHFRECGIELDIPCNPPPPPPPSLQEEAYKKGSFDEYLASQDDDNNRDVYKKGSFDITEVQLASQDDDNNGDVPVVPGLTGDPSQWG
jgi:hypothetical protein